MQQPVSPNIPVTPTPNIPAPSAPAQTGIPDTLHHRGGFYPRQLMLGLLLIAFGTIIGYALWIYYQFHICTYGVICRPDTWPGVVQVTILWGSYAITCFVATLFVPLIEIRNPRRNPGFDAILVFFRDISEFMPVRWMFVACGGVAAFGLLILWYLGRIQNGGAIGYSGILIFLALRLAFYDPRPRPRTAQEQLQRGNAGAANPINVFRNMPGINRLFPRHPPRTQPDQTPPLFPQQPLNQDGDHM
jgi:hypothetical protein